MSRVDFSEFLQVISFGLRWGGKDYTQNVASKFVAELSDPQIQSKTNGKSSGGSYGYFKILAAQRLALSA